MLKFIHAADWHLDSAFGALPARQAAQRRRESRELPKRLAEYVRSRGVDLVLLAGDLFDTDSAYRDTTETLAAAFARMEVPVLIAPGNHDCFGPGSAWDGVVWPDNVHIFREGRMTAVDFPKWNLTVHGAAFTAPDCPESLLAGFAAPANGRVHIGLLHGEVEPAEARYNPIRRQDIAASGLAYLALGHIHKRMGLQVSGNTLWAWPGCIEGRGFDELGEKGFYEGTISDDGVVHLTFVPFARRRYEVLTVDVTGKDPRAAVEEALPSDTEQHLYRILLTGETGEAGVHIPALQESLSERFYALELRDRTRMAEDVWARAEEDSLRGLFLRELRAKLAAAQTEEERETITRAARFGLAALDRRDLE